MTPETAILMSSFGLELTKLAFPQALAQAAQRATHGAGRVGAEVLSGIPTRMGMKGMQRSREQLLGQLQRLEEMARNAKPPKKGFFQGAESHQQAVDEWARMQEAIGQRTSMLKEQLPIFEAEALRLGQHLEGLKQAPWTTPL